MYTDSYLMNVTSSMFEIDARHEFSVECSAKFEVTGEDRSALVSSIKRFIVIRSGILLSFSCQNNIQLMKILYKQSRLAFMMENTSTFSSFRPVVDFIILATYMGILPIYGSGRTNVIFQVEDLFQVVSNCTQLSLSSARI